MNSKARILFAVAVILAVVAADQVTKLLARRHLAGSPPVVTWNGVLTLEYAENTGSFLGLGANLPEWTRFVFLVVVNGALVTFLSLFLFGRSRLPAGAIAALALVIAGGLGNLIDRLLFHGRVIDFARLRVAFFQTGIFNFADLAILVGAGMLLIMSVRSGFGGQPEAGA